MAMESHLSLLVDGADISALQGRNDAEMAALQAFASTSVALLASSSESTAT